MRIEKIAVIGSGVMGSGIAGQIANAGLPVLLFDLDAPREIVSSMKDAGARGALMHESRAELIEPLSLKTDLDRLGEVDWICEVVVENLDIKRDLYEKIDAYRRPHSVISSNTSTIPLEHLVKGRSQAFKEHFLITHFFNPPRHMRLLEMVTGADTKDSVADMMTEFCQNVLGKAVVPCFDSPGFIANRIGVYWMMNGLHKAIAQNIEPNAADAYLSKQYKLPKTGLFGLMDLIGLDLMPKMASSLADNLPKADHFHDVSSNPDLLSSMIDTGFTGRKGKGGFTRMIRDKETGKKQFLTATLNTAFDPDTSYAQHSSNHGDVALWGKEIMNDMITYARALVGEVSNSKDNIDAAMVWGYNWSQGPFAMAGDIITLPRPHDTLLVSHYNNKIIKENEHAVLSDMGDRISLLSFKTKMNIFDSGIFDLLEYGVMHDHDGLIIATDGDHFSAGANIERFLDFAEHNDWDGLNNFIKRGQDVIKAVRLAPIPVICAINGYVMGGACELALHSSTLIAHCETSIGLVEPRVGVIPAWGGCIEALRRMGAEQALRNILTQWTSGSALEAKIKGFIGDLDPIVMNRDLLLSRAVMLVKRADIPQKRVFTPVTDRDIKAMNDWLNNADLSSHNRQIGQVLITVLSSQTEDDMWNAEREGFVALLKTDESQERIKTILKR